MKWAQWQRQQKDKYKAQGGKASEWTQHMGGAKAAKAAWKRETKVFDDEQKSGRKKLHKSTLVYPQDLGGNEFYPEAIKFTIFKRRGASLEKIQKDLGQISNLVTTIGRAEDPAKKVAEELKAATAAWETAKSPGSNKEKIAELNSRKEFWKDADKKFKNGEPITNLAGVLSASAKTAAGIIKEGTVGMRQTSYNEIKKETSKIMGEVYMNMPNEINFNEEANWGGTDLGLVGSLTKGEGMEAALSTTFANFSNVVGGGTAALGALALKMGKHGAMAGAVLGTLGGEAIQKSLESGTGQVANPYKEMTFSGIGFRQFSFNFTFRARNADEVEVIQDIIETFRYYSKPTYTHGKSGFFSYPEEFLIEFLMKVERNGSETYETNHFIPQLKMCVLKTVTTNFSPQNAWRSFRSSAPVEISLALTFEETEVVTGEDIIGETPVGRFKDSGRRF